MNGRTKFSIGLAFVASMAFAAATHAQVFVGSYQVDDGPFWGDIPDVLTAQEAAAVVFGGDAGDYRISTNASMDPGTITDTGWYGTIGIGGGEIFAHDFSLDGGGAGYGAAGWVGGEDISAYVTDNAVGPKYTNYVWTPAPGALALLGLGAAFTRRRRRA